MQALKKSNCHTDSMDDAELIYIDDYCYYTWWLASIHSLGPDTRAEAGKYLLKVPTKKDILPHAAPAI